MRYTVIIPAAGIGQRFSAKTPKQYELLAGKPVLSHVIDFFLAFSFVQQIVVAIGQDDPYWPLLASFKNPKVAAVTGGKERFDSVLNALQFLHQTVDAQDWMVIHDACRPCSKTDDFLKLVNTLNEDPVGGLLGVPVRDTLKNVDAQKNILGTLDRNALWHAQTPQIFRYGILCEALKEAAFKKIPITDEAMALELAGLKPKMVEGSHSNLKITWPEDLLLAEAILGKNI